MSNPNKEWLNDRANEAWEDLTKIAERVEKWRENGADSGYAFDYFHDIIDILEEGGWM